MAKNDDVGWSFDDSPSDENVLAEVYDPLEPFNRLMSQINNAIDKMFLKPIAEIYRVLIPMILQKAIENFAYNFFSPVRVINFALQKDSENVVNTFFGFLVNTFFGFFGAFDVASKIGLKSRNTSLGDTLKKWGAGPGPYIVLPVLGPTSFRGAIGKAFHMRLDPIAVISLMRYGKNTRNKLYYIIYGTDLLAKRVSLLDIMKEIESFSSDPYVTTRASVMALEK
jgi:phospholipid-binding lipoprotein MlaA